MAAPAQVLTIEPGEVIRFNGSFQEVVTSELKLTNPTDDQIAFKVKTTAPRRYAVRPNSGVLNAGETVSVSVMRQPFDFDPAEKVRHKFMIQSVKMQPGQTLNNIWTEADPSLLMDTRLRVQFDDSPPSNRTTEASTEQPLDKYEQSETSAEMLVSAVGESIKSSFTDEEYHRVVSDNERLSKEVEELKEERLRLRDIAMSDNPGALLRQQLPKGLSLIFHEKKNVVLIVILLIVFFVIGIYAADAVMSLIFPPPAAK